jgi:hypothetical protein
MAMKTLEELYSATSAAAWIPSEAWADLILDATLCYGQLSGKITAVDYDMQAGMGKTVKVRMVPSRTAQTPAAGACLSDTSAAVTVATITIGQYADYDYLWDFALWQTKGPVKEKIANEMAKSLAKARDVALITALKTALATKPSTVGSRCTTTVNCLSTTTYGGCANGSYKYLQNFYNSIVSVAASLKGRGFNPDTLIISPTAARWFHMRDVTENPAHWGDLRFSPDGSVLAVAGLKVVESCNMTACNATSSATMAFVIDSSRALAEAWGMRPTFYEQFTPDCNKTKLTIWSYWGCSVASHGAIGSVINP